MILTREKDNLQNFETYIKTNNITHCNLPFNIDNIILTAFVTAPKDNKLTQEEIADDIFMYLDNLPQLLYGNITGPMATFYTSRLKIVTAILAYKLYSKKLIGLTRSGMKYLLSKISQELQNNLLSPGEASGVRNATSIGESCTQMTLDSFHFSGVIEKVLQGFPRLNKVLRASAWKKTDRGKHNRSIYTKLYWKDVEKNVDETEMHNFALTLNYVKLQDVLDTYMIINDTKFTSGSTIIPEDMKHVQYYYKRNCVKKIRYPKLSIRLVLNKDKLKYLGIPITTIKMILLTTLDYNMKIIILSENILRIYVINQDIHKVYDELLSLIINGINNVQGITNITTEIDQQYDKKTRRCKEIKRHVLNLLGTNMIELFKYKDIDKTRSWTNDIRITYNMFGIEATRNVIYKNIINILESNNITNLSKKIIGAIADYQTSAGIPVALAYNGMDRYKSIEPLQKVTNERSKQFIINAALYNQIDNVKSPSAAVYYGQHGGYGTGMCRILQGRS